MGLHYQNTGCPAQNDSTLVVDVVDDVQKLQHQNTRQQTRRQAQAEGRATRVRQRKRRIAMDAPSEIPDNLAAMLHGIDDLRLEQIPVLKPGRNEVLIAMHSVGICGSDVHYLKKGACGSFIVKAPMVLGHESSGTISQLGDGVKHLKVGDRVAIEPGIPCRICDFCKSGRYNLCLEMKFCATPPVHGTLCRYYVHAADFCFKLPDNVSYEEGALLEPLSVGVHACNRAGITNGHHVLVCGAGPIGLVNMMTAKACGASKVAITDLDENRLAVAKKLGADEVFKVDCKDGKIMAEKITEKFGMVDRTIECTGAESSIHTGIYATKSGGVVVIVGLSGSTEMKIPIINALFREVDIRGIFRYTNCYPIALEMVATGRVDLKSLITHRFKLEQSKDAFEASGAGKDGAIKVVINCTKD